MRLKCFDDIPNTSRFRLVQSLLKDGNDIYQIIRIGLK